MTELHCEKNKEIKKNKKNKAVVFTKSCSFDELIPTSNQS